MIIKERLEEIFRDIFDDESIILTKETKAEDIEDWDSLANINILLAIEQEFKVKISLSEISKLKNIGDILDLITKKIGE